MIRLMFWMSALLVILSSCNSWIGETEDPYARILNSEKLALCANNECPCESPLGDILHGGQVPIFNESSTACNVGCESVKQIATCNNGQFDIDISDKYFKCFTQDCPQCFRGANLLENGQSADFYSKPLVECRESCDDFKEHLTCVMGTFEPEAPQHLYSSCDRRVCRCELPNNGGFVNLDGKVKLYNTERAACGNTCDGDHSQERLCIDSNQNGETIFTLTGDAQYQYLQCEEATNCFCTLPYNDILGNGDTTKVYVQNQVSCFESQCEQVQHVEVRCDNGTFKKVSDNSVVDFSSGQYSQYAHKCIPQTCKTCKYDGTNSVPHEGTWDFFDTESPSCGNNSRCEDHKQTCTCSDGQWTDCNSTSYNKPYCTPRDCKCAIPGDSAIEVPYPNGSHVFFDRNVAECGTNCEDHSLQRTCNVEQFDNLLGRWTYDFSSSTTYSFPSCEEQQGCECNLPPAFGYTLADGQFLQMFKAQTPPNCAQNCEEHVAWIRVKCHNGTLRLAMDGQAGTPVDPATTDFKYNCSSQGQCANCDDLPGDISIGAGKKLDLYRKFQMTCSDNPLEHKFKFHCDGGGNLFCCKSNSLGFCENPEVAYDPSLAECGGLGVTAWHLNYEVDCDGCALPWGGALAVGGTTVGYKHFGTTVNPCGRGCKQSDFECVEDPITGIPKLVGDTSYDKGDCPNTCTEEGGGAPPRLCLLPWMNSWVTPDTEITVWTRKTATNCDNFKLTVRCKMETGTFDLPMNEAYYQSCTDQ